MGSFKNQEFDPLGVIIRPAATLVMIRDSPGNNAGAKSIEPAQHPYSEVTVLLLQRSLTASFVPGAFVFADGAIDAADKEMALENPFSQADTSTRSWGLQEETES